MEGQPIITNFDIHAQVGPNAAYDLTFPVTVADGVLNLAFTASVDRANLNGLVITQSPVPFQDLATWQTFYFGSPAATSARPNLDPDSDDPRIADSAHITPVHSIASPPSAKLMLEYCKSMPGLDYRVQWTTSLVPASWSEAGVENETYHSPTDTYRRSIPVLPGEPKKFIRMKAEN